MELKIIKNIKYEVYLYNDIFYFIKYSLNYKKNTNFFNTTILKNNGVFDPERASRTYDDFDKRESNEIFDQETSLPTEQPSWFEALVQQEIPIIL